MGLDVKLFVALAPVFLAGMVYALTQADWWIAGGFVFLMFMMVVLYRIESGRGDGRRVSPTESVLVWGCALGL